MVDLNESLAKGLDALSLSLTAEQRHKLMAYQELIHKWNRVYNLTAVRDPQEMLTHHLLDSLAVILPLQRQLTELPKKDTYRLLDVGSGAGLPGVIIAIACPSIDVTCVDTVAKKATFIQQVALTLKLPNLHGLHARVESIQTHDFDVISSRAFSSLQDFTTWSHNALAPQGIWMAMKGKHPEQELQVLSSRVKVFHVEQLTVPGLVADRCILWMRG
jgi:16S rRNA (guanine527-N7)-methyltransferase